MNLQKLFLVAFFSIILLFSVAALSDASALKGKGTHNQKFGSATKNIVCGDKLCSEVMRDGKTNPQSKFAMYGVHPQGIESRGVVKQQEALPPTDTVCDDYDPNTTDVMVEGICVSTQITSDAIPCDDGDPNTTGDVTYGIGYRCVGISLADGESCDDGDPNTTGDVMGGGLCRGWAQNYSTPTIPSILTGLEITDVTLTSIHIIWTASNDPQLANDPIYYALSRSTSVTGPFTNIGYLLGPGFTDTNLSPGTTYYYQVYAYNSIGQSQPSAITATTVVSSIPTNLTATTLSTTSLKISWTAAGDVSRYTIVRSTSQSGPFAYAGSSFTPAFTDTNLSPGTTYYYQISASTVNGPSEMSAIVSGTTQANPTKSPTTNPNTQCQPGYHYDERGKCVLQNPANPTTGSLPSLSINDVTMNEGHSGVSSMKFTISISELSSEPITFYASIRSGTAKAGSPPSADFGFGENGPEKKLTIPAGSRYIFLTVPIFGDTVGEQHESFSVYLTMPQGASIHNGHGIGMITNDD